METHVCTSSTTGPLSSMTFGLMLGKGHEFRDLTLVNSKLTTKEAMLIISKVFEMPLFQTLGFTGYPHTTEILPHLVKTILRTKRPCKLVLNGVKLDTRVFFVLAQLLYTHTTLCLLDLTNTINADTAYFITEPLRHNRSITHLELKNNLALTATNVRNLCDALMHHRTFKSLNLSGCLLFNESVLHVLKLARTNHSFTELNLSKNEFSAHAADFLTGTALTMLYLTDNKLTNRALGNLYEALAINTTLTILEAPRHNKLTEPVPIRPNVLSANTTLVQLNLTCWNLTVDSLSTILMEVATSRALRVFRHKTSNAICLAVVSQTVNLLRQNRTLVGFELGNMPVESHKQVLVDAMRSNPSIRHLGKSYPDLDPFTARNKHNRIMKTRTLLTMMIARPVIKNTLNNHTPKRQRTQ